MIKELNYTLDNQDYKTFGKEYNSLLRKERKNIKFTEIITYKFIATIIIYIVLASIVLFYNINGYIKIKVIIFVIVFAFAVIMRYLVYKNILGVTFAFNNKQKNSININTETGIISGKMCVGKKEYINPHINTYKIYNTEKNLSIIVSKKHSAIIIPKRIFSSEEEMNETWALIQECYNKSR